MMKKLIKVGVVMSLLLTSTSAFAQEKAEYPNYGFWSNWSIGFGPAVTWQLGQHSWDNDAPTPVTSGDVPSTWVPTSSLRRS